MGDGVKAARDAPPDKSRRRVLLPIRNIRTSVEPKRIAIECGVIALLGVALAGVSIGLLFLQYGDQYGKYLKFGVEDVVIACSVGIVAAAIVRFTVLLHRRLKPLIGRVTAAAALCALAGIAGALVTLVPGECPGGLFETGRCGVREAAAWGQVAGLAAVLNFGIAGIGLLIWRLLKALARGVRDVVRDGSMQGVAWAKALKRVWRRRVTRRAPDEKERGPQDPKGRPTRRRADAERARRGRLRAGT